MALVINQNDACVFLKRNLHSQSNQAMSLENMRLMYEIRPEGLLPQTQRRMPLHLRFPGSDVVLISLDN